MSGFGSGFCTGGRCLLIRGPQLRVRSGGLRGFWKLWVRVGLLSAEPRCRAVRGAVFQGTSLPGGSDSPEALPGSFPKGAGPAASPRRGWGFLHSELLRVLSAHPPPRCQNRTPSPVNSAGSPLQGRSFSFLESKPLTFPGWGVGGTRPHV